MRKLTTREIYLVGILALGGVGYLWYWSQQGEILSGAQGAAEGAKVALANHAPVIPIHLVERKAEPYDRGGRNLFQYSKRPPTAEELAARRRAEELARRQREEAEKARLAALEAQRLAAQAAPPPPQGPVMPQPPGIPLEYIGYFGPKEDKIAVFLNGEEQLLARAGDTLQDRFRVVEIRFETVVMGYTDPRFEDRTRELAVVVGTR